MLRWSISAILIIGILSLSAQETYFSEEGNIHFISDAPLELIEAENANFKIVLDTTSKEFAVVITIEGFKGFNSALQQEHFYENYMEIDRFPRATYLGKIIGDLSYRTEMFKVMAKGNLDLHGKKQEKIIEVECRWLSQDELQISSSFEIFLGDHNIEIPRVVFQKIAEEIRVTLVANLRSREG